MSPEEFVIQTQEDINRTTALINHLPNLEAAEPSVAEVIKEKRLTLIDAFSKKVDGRIKDYLS